MISCSVVNQSCIRACLAVGRIPGSISSIHIIRSLHSGENSSKYSGIRLKLHYLFLVNTYYLFAPLNRQRPVIKLKKSEPKLKMSHLAVYPSFRSTSGATQHGVPHFSYSFSRGLEGANVASPKSAILTLQSSPSQISLISTLSSLMSLCMIFF